MEGGAQAGADCRRQRQEIIFTSGATGRTIGAHQGRRRMYRDKGNKSSPVCPEQGVIDSARSSRNRVDAYLYAVPKDGGSESTSWRRDTDRRSDHEMTPTTRSVGSRDAEIGAIAKERGSCPHDAV